VGFHHPATAHAGGSGSHGALVHSRSRGAGERAKPSRFRDLPGNAAVPFSPLSTIMTSITPESRASRNLPPTRHFNFRVADLHVVICQVKARVSRARSGERANQQFQDVLGATVCLSASVPALGRTRHPFAVSGLEGPSPKIEFVFSASPETIRREPREGDLLRSVGNMQDLAVCAFCSSC
jgi:hypothetical protein